MSGSIEASKIVTFNALDQSGAQASKLVTFNVLNQTAMQASKIVTFLVLADATPAVSTGQFLNVGMI